MGARQIDICYIGVLEDIILAIANGHKTLEDIAKFLKRESGGDLSLILDNLCSDGFIAHDYSWSFKRNKISRKNQYRLKDNYLRFYLHYVLPNRHRIEINAMPKLPQGWESIIGLQFENLVINNRGRLHQLLKIPPEEILMSNPYLQSETKRHKKCQVDYLIQTKFNTLYLCEIKFSKHEIGNEVIKEVQEKIDRLAIPRGFSVRPVLVHANGVTDELLSTDFFANVVDFSELLYHS